MSALPGVGNHVLHEVEARRGLADRGRARHPAGMAEERDARERWREIIFEAETKAGRRFDVTLLLVISLSIAAVMLESVPSVAAEIGGWLYLAEWVFTGIFSIEYAARLWTSRAALRYARSFYGVVDLLSILPSFIGLLLPGGQALMVIRVLRCCGFSGC